MGHHDYTVQATLGERIMPKRTLNRTLSREVDRLAIQQFGMTGLVLMENAGRGVVDTLVRLGVEGPVYIVCGKGNNAGDGFVIARHLDLRGYSPVVVLPADSRRLTGDARANFEILSKTDVLILESVSESDTASFVADLSNADWIVDALLGTGASGEPRRPLDKVIDLMNDAPAKKLAVDLPTGLDCDSGIAASHTFHSHHTCSFVAAKPGFYIVDGPQCTGQIHVLDIGVPRQLVEKLLSQSHHE